MENEMVDEDKNDVDENPPAYRNKIQGMLNKIDLGEKVFDPKPVDTVGNIIASDGVQDGIRGIFDDKKQIVKESVEEEVETVQKNDAEQDSPKETSLSSFANVDEKKDAPDIFPVWEKARSYLGRLGSRIDDGPAFVSRKVNLGGGEVDDITIRLAKHKERDGVPYMQVSFGDEADATPAESAVPYIENVGVRVAEETIFESPEGNTVYFEFDA